ncbi:hypothetical protein NDU88_004531 [Pleurodeles waltl]|uniref:Uncharacterized protein n=1 Tax=Pleurodeles waltl TaxID=8319 RepID=A0AAV7LLM0_PLEWA|nr:hypothetical protein NDU88_004531 [Pleurodeles waltl]
MPGYILTQWGFSRHKAYSGPLPQASPASSFAGPRALPPQPQRVPFCRRRRLCYHAAAGTFNLEPRGQQAHFLPSTGLSGRSPGVHHSQVSPPLSLLLVGPQDPVCHLLLSRGDPRAGAVKSSTTEPCTHRAPQLSSSVAVHTALTGLLPNHGPHLLLIAVGAGGRGPCHSCTRGPKGCSIRRQ